MATYNTTPSLRLLLVEDNKHDVLAFRRALKDSPIPCHITHFTRAETALERLIGEAAAFDLVICDHNLPGMTGLELCKELLGQKINLPLVLLTGSGAESLAVEALKSGVNDYIIKDPHQGYLSLLPVVLPEVVRNYQDRQARERAEAALAKRERYLAALVKVQQQLLAFDSKENYYSEILKTLGQASKASRVYIFENHPWSGGPLLTSRKAEWCAEGITSQITNPALQSMPLLPNWTERLRQGGYITGIVVDFPLSERKILESQGILTILILPLVVNEKLFGFIGFDNCLEARLWEQSEIDLLQAAAVGISLWQERRQAEEKLRQYTAELQNRNAELDAFGHTVAHDLKNPLTALTGIAEVLAADYIQDESLSHYLQAIVRSGRKAHNIVEELLVLASVRRQEEIVLEPLDMAEIIEEVKERLMYMIEEAQAELILPGSWPAALGYPPWIEEVWANYLSNAIKYGGRPPKVELGAQVQADGKVRFWIRDNGPGLSPAQQARLFTPFTQLKQARVKGHGLGLSIVRRIIEKFNGQVGVESDGQPHHGSTFYFTLPQAEHSDF